MGSKPFLGFSGHALSVLQIALIVCPSFILFGYNQAGLGGLITESDWNKTFPEIDTADTTGAKESHNSTIQGLVVAVFTLGALVGALSCSYTGDKFGRRAIIFAGAICTLIGEVLECSSFSLAQFIVGRVILGAGVGMLSATVPVWQSETSGAKNRGKHVVLDGLFISFGYTLESWIDLGFFTYGDSPKSWRPPLAIPIAFSILLICAIYFFPESPRWLVRKNRMDQAKETLAALKNLEEDSFEVQAELAGIAMSLEETSAGATSLKDMLKMGEDKLLYRFLLCIVLQFFQQMSGTNLISVYTTIIFQDNLGLGAEQARALSGGALTWKFLSSFVAFFTIDRFGRRAVFMFSGAGMSLCMVALCIATSFGKENHSAQIAAGVFIYLFNFFVPIGFLGANFLYCTEVAPIRLRVAMSSISTANHWLWNFVVTMITPVALANIGYRYYIIYAVIGFLIPVSVYFFYPETMGRNLEELDLLFRESPSVMATVKFAKKKPRSTPAEFALGKEEASMDPELKSQA
ncbi:putative sugar transporter [Saccharata proteae CBS 121410]|uniref:Sugar transporter n=1 Tax=Saccharata proteae CBS 121410 TaxID=1314787 RepID=A0A9P4LXA1_9PEZI|nr:putative sugar transporter [Saccharata proteae CBS 121410]